MALSVDYVANASRDQLGVIDINEPVNGVRPGVAVFDPTGTIIPAEARGVSFQRVLQSQTSAVFDGDYKSMQVSLVKRMANRWSGRLAYTLQRSNYVGIGNPDARRVWLDNDPRADYGEFIVQPHQRVRRQRHLEPVAVAHLRHRGQRHQRLADQRDRRPRRQRRPRQQRPANPRHRRPGPADRVRPRPTRAAPCPSASAGPDSFLVDLSVRYQLPLGGRLESLDFFFDMFNVFNRLNEVAPTGNRSVAELHGRDFGAVPAAERSSASGCDSEVTGDASTGNRGTGGGGAAVRRRARRPPRWSWASSRGGSSTRPASRSQGVTIRLVNVDRGREVTLTTDKDGRFYRRGSAGGRIRAEGRAARATSRSTTRSRLWPAPTATSTSRWPRPPPAGRRSSRRASPHSTAATSRTAATQFEAAIAQSPTVAPLHVNLALAYFRLKRPPRRSPASRRPPRSRRATPPSSSSSAAPTSTLQAYDKAVAALEKGLCRQSEPGQGRRWRRGRVDPRRRLLRAGQDRRGGGAVPAGARARKPGAAGATLGMAKVHFSKGEVGQGARAVRAGRRRSSRHARGRAGRDVHQGAPEGPFARRTTVMKHIGAACAALALLLAATLLAQEKGGGDETGPYDLVAGWPQNYCGEGFVIGSTGGIWAESPDRVYIFNRGCLPVLKETRGAADSFIPSRNASGYDLSQKDPARHPRWDHVVQRRRSQRQADRVVGSAQQDVRAAAPRAGQPVRSRPPRLAGRRRRARHLQVHPRRQEAGA